MMVSSRRTGTRLKRGSRPSNLRLAEPAATEGTTVGDPAGGTGRRAIVGRNVEHVGVLYSPTALREARAWLDAVFALTSGGPVSATGGPIVLLLVGIVILAWPLSRLLPEGKTAPSTLSLRTFLMAVLIRAVSTPVLLSFVETRFLPVLVADYLAAHLFVYGLMALRLLIWCRIRIGDVAWIAALTLAGYGIFVFGGALDRYVRRSGRFHPGCRSSPRSPWARCRTCSPTA
ncbi:MAG: hypothetical protein K2Y71_13100 [Xanthobacteraceae bacterium]|nr:hypothetical protein [Xanthobacteraceae bacterium]